MGKIILLIIILFCIFFGAKYIKAKTKKTPLTVEEFIDYFNEKISEIECKSSAEIDAATEKIKYYKEELEKLKTIKNNRRKA